MMPNRTSFDFTVPQSDATTMKTYGEPAAWPANRTATFMPIMTYPRVPDDYAQDPKGAVRVMMPRGHEMPLHALGAVDAQGRAFSFGRLRGLGVDCDTGPDGPRSLFGRWFCKGTDAFFDKDAGSQASKLIALLVFGLVTLSAVKALPKILGSV